MRFQPALVATLIKALPRLQVLRIFAMRLCVLFCAFFLLVAGAAFSPVHANADSAAQRGVAQGVALQGGKF